MSSLAAARADNFYFPKDFDPDKHKSLNKYHGQHALRDRARKIDQGILIIRFEVPFHIWCSKCGEKIAKGERFNAEKKGIGFYHSTRIWQFSMRHHCGCIITIQTDPKKAEYLVVEGARKKVEGTQSAADAEVIELADDQEKERLAKDPLYRLEKGEQSKKRARSAAEEVAELLDEADAKHADPYTSNRILRAKLRVIRKADEALDKERRALNLPEEVPLLPASEDDDIAAKLAFYAHDAGGGGASTQQAEARRAILGQSIFSSSGSGAGQHRQQPSQGQGAGSNRSAPYNMTVSSGSREDDGSSGAGPSHGGGSGSATQLQPSKRHKSHASGAAAAHQWHKHSHKLLSSSARHSQDMRPGQPVQQEGAFGSQDEEAAEASGEERHADGAVSRLPPVGHLVKARKAGVQGQGAAAQQEALQGTQAALESKGEGEGTAEEKEGGAAAAGGITQPASIVSTALTVALDAKDSKQVSLARSVVAAAKHSTEAREKAVKAVAAWTAGLAARKQQQSGQGQGHVAAGQSAQGPVKSKGAVAQKAAMLAKLRAASAKGIGF